MRATESVSVSVHQEISKEGLTLSQFGVLDALYHLGPLCQKDIAAKILKSTGNITMVVDNLEKRELVLRRRKSDDRRFYLVELTSAGRRLMDRVFPPHVNRIKERLGVLDDQELKLLGSLLRKLGRDDPKREKRN
jgi:MarR family 2-MHQ and catechol resistance regulon transcriptional repressor